MCIRDSYRFVTNSQLALTARPKGQGARSRQCRLAFDGSHFQLLSRLNREMIETRSGTAADSGIVALAMLLRFHGIAADVDQIRHQVGNGPFGTPEMLR